ncbi:hypothetical protein ACN47E_000608 [Coniothyrium glycines]
MPSSSVLLYVGAILSTFSSPALATLYEKEQKYAGSNFLDAFKFETYEKTNGFVDYVNEATAKSSGLYKVDGTDVVFGADSTERLDPWSSTAIGRKSVRLEGKTDFNKGLFVLEVKQMPSVCGMWPAFWSLGREPWPVKGEIDIIEGVNKNTVNKYSLHTDAKCNVNSINQAYPLLADQCSIYGSNGYSGCNVNDARTNGYGDGLNNNGGGIYAMEWDSTGIRTWFFPRGSTPSSLTTGQPDTTQFGTPAANFKGDCDIDQRFKDHRFIFTNTFCGDWAGNVYSTSGCPKYYDNTGKELDSVTMCKVHVAQNPSAFVNAKWRIGSFKTYTKKSVVSSSSVTRTSTRVSSSVRSSSTRASSSSARISSSVRSSSTRASSSSARVSSSVRSSSTPISSSSSRSSSVRAFSSSSTRVSSSSSARVSSSSSARVSSSSSVRVSSSSSTRISSSSSIRGSSTPVLSSSARVSSTPVLPFSVRTSSSVPSSTSQARINAVSSSVRSSASSSSTRRSVRIIGQRRSIVHSFEAVHAASSATPCPVYDNSAPYPDHAYATGYPSASDEADYPIDDDDYPDAAESTPIITSNAKQAYETNAYPVRFDSKSSAAVYGEHPSKQSKSATNDYPYLPDFTPVSPIHPDATSEPVHGNGYGSRPEVSQAYPSKPAAEVKVSTIISKVYTTEIVTVSKVPVHESKVPANESKYPAEHPSSIPDKPSTPAQTPAVPQPGKPAPPSTGYSYPAKNTTVPYSPGGAKPSASQTSYNMPQFTGAASTVQVGGMMALAAFAALLL